MIDRIVVIFFSVKHETKKMPKIFFKHNFIVNFNIYNKEDKILLDLKNKY